ncbi:MAG: hypothetical protein DME13_12495 [Candidatus Rokuibacteriota bacterium]|nr:MAG: hypothetical protein DME13_12495 [Candidatus Rokubacteria bacterium]
MPTGLPPRSSVCRAQAESRIGSTRTSSRARHCSISRRSSSPISPTRSGCTIASSSSTPPARPSPASSRASARKSRGASPSDSSTSALVTAPQPSSIPGSWTRCSVPSPTASTDAARTSRRGRVCSRRPPIVHAPAISSPPTIGCCSFSSSRSGTSPASRTTRSSSRRFARSSGACAKRIPMSPPARPAIAVTVGLLFLVIRRTVEPLLMLGVLLLSLAWSFGVITAVVGHLSVFSVMFMSLLVGLGIDYGIYLFLRYEEELRLGRTPRHALMTTAGHSGPGILFGALTAAGTFGVLMLAEFRGIQEFGFIAATAIVMAFVAMITVFPALLVMTRRRLPVVPATAPIGQNDAPWPRRLMRHRLVILVVAMALTVGALLALPAIRFDYNRLNLQAPGMESVIWERKIMESRRSGFAALATADSLAELRAKQGAFAALPGVSEVVSVLKLVPADQEAKIGVVHAFARLVVAFHVGDQSAVDRAAIQRALQMLRRRLEIAAAEAEGHTAETTLRSAHERTVALLARLASGDAQLASRLAHVQLLLRDDFIATLRKLQDNLAPRPVTVSELPPELTRKFIGASGRLLMLIYPGIDTWEREGAREFVRQLRSVDAAVTGSPVISYEASRMVEAAYLQGTFYAAGVVALLAAVMLRRSRDTLLALVPLGLATLWTIGLMHLLGLSFNLANVWGLPLVVGTSAEYGINVMLRYREQTAAGRTPFPRSAILAVALNGLTTMTGFGSLMVARHRGIFGLGLFLTIGAAAALAASLVLLPLLLMLFDRPAAGPAREQDGKESSCHRAVRSSSVG